MGRNNLTRHAFVIQQGDHIHRVTSDAFSLFIMEYYILGSNAHAAAMKYSFSLFCVQKRITTDLIIVYH